MEKKKKLWIGLGVGIASAFLLLVLVPVIIVVALLSRRPSVPESSTNENRIVYEILREENDSEVVPEWSIYLTAVKLVRVIDGDTIEIETASGTKQSVRLISVDCEESKASQDYLEKTDKTNNEFGLLSEEYLNRTLDPYVNEYIYLEYDVELTDNYGRTLAYVWLEPNMDDMMNCLNALIIKDGYGKEMTIEPNIKYSEKFSDLEEVARENMNGLWALEDFK